MSIRKLRALLMGPLLVLSLLFVPMVGRAEASPAGPATVCAIAGTVFVDATGQLPFGQPTPGTYSFNNVAIVCAGGLTGVSLSTTSNGSTGPACGPAFALPILGQFCGPYNAPTDLPAPGPGCSGNVGGTGLWNPGAGVGNWSLTVGNVILGHADCGAGSNGVLALVAVPTSINVAALGGNPIDVNPVPILGLNRDCPSTGAAIPPLEPQIWACSIFVAGVAVLADVPV